MLKPHFIINTITDITVDFLRENSIDALLLDVDNTLSVAHKNKTLRIGVVEWLESMQKSGIKLIVLSNAKAERAKAFAKSIGLDAVGLAAKPLPFGYLKAVKILEKSKGTTAVVGDQIFTDILGGRLAGIKTILVTDINPEQTLSFKIRRKIEQKLRKRWENGR